MAGVNDYSVKIYYINPIDSISIIIDALINLEYEVYTLSEYDKGKLLKIIPKENTRVVIFFSILNRTEVEGWLKFVGSVKALNLTGLQLGAFSYDLISEEEKNKFLSNSVPIILFSAVEKNTIEIIQNLLTIFEAKGKRAFIRVKTLGNSDVYFYFKIREEPLIMKIIDISASAFSVEVEDSHKNYFEINSYLSDVLIILMGTRIRVNVKVAGFSVENPNIFIFKFCSSTVVEHKVVYTDITPKDVNLKIHNFIRKCLKRDITMLLDEADETRQAKTKPQD